MKALVAFFPLTIIILLAMALLSPAATLTSQKLSSIEFAEYQSAPLTTHAMNSHQGQAWDATSVNEYFSSGKCVPKIYVCPDLDIKVFWCQMNKDKAIGLIRGLTNDQILTGFMAEVKYWKNRCK